MRATADGSRAFVLDDPTRGRRRVVLGPDRLPIAVERADGTRLEIGRDRLGRLVSIACDGRDRVCMEFDADGELRVTDTGGSTVARALRNTVEVTRNGHRLRLDVDGDGRPRRVTLPGSERDLEYRFAGAGCWSVGPLGGRAVLDITESPDGMTVELAGGGGWRERRRAGELRYTALDGTPLATVAMDAAGRVTSRHWAGGALHRYERDDERRLLVWEHGGRREERRYRGGNLSEVVRDGARWAVRSDAGRRITELIGPRRTVAYTYDANGARVERRAGRERTTYSYDGLGQLVAVTSKDGAATRYGWDGLGRRTWVDHGGRRLFEHRAPDGRLWSVTDAHGNALHTFVWWGGRVLGRIDGPVGDPLAEVYLCDGLGTLVGDGRPAGAGEWRFEEAIQPPFGAATGPWRPTLFGHIADGATPLICFGSRDLDPETGCFLTPDPWHGDADDPRHLGGRARSALLAARELPLGGIHPYAVSQHDPLGRPDHDGHFAVFNSILWLILGPTWGFPLTSLSVFLFEPLNLYMEVLGLLGLILSAIFGSGKHPWPQHSIGNMRGLVGSTRLGTYGLALNGFLPRVVAGRGVDSDRAVTVGYVPWENRRYFTLLDRPRVLELDDVRGTPAPDGTPTADARRFSDAGAGSAVAVIGSEGGRDWVHVSWWTRGAGNAVALRGAAQSFEDHSRPGAPHVRGTLHLAQPLPEAIPKPAKAGDAGTLKVVEYGTAGGHSSTAELQANVLFALVVDENAGIPVGRVLEVKAKGDVTPAFAVVSQLVPAAEPVLILDHELPPTRFAGSDLRKGLTLRKMVATARTSAGWATVASPPAIAANRVLSLAAPGHDLAVDEVIEVAPASGPPPERPKAYGRIEKITVTLRLDPSLGPLNLTGATIYRLAPDGTAVVGKVPNPPPSGQVNLFTDSHGLRVDDLVQIQPTAGGGTPHYGRVESVTAANPGATPPVPSSITIAPPCPFAAGADVRVGRLAETDRDADKGSNVTQPLVPGDRITAEVSATEKFPAERGVRIEVGGATHVRRVAAVELVEVQLEDEYVGAGPYTVVVYQAEPNASKVGARMSSDRFVKRTGGDALSAYGAWPAEVLGIVPDNYGPIREPEGWKFFLRAPAGAPFHPDYGAFWQPFTVGASDYWLLASPLKIVADGADFYWEPDPDDTYPRRHRHKVSPPFTVTVRGLAKTGVERPDPGGGPVFAGKAETQVPDSPRIRWSLADALDEHELSHTRQNTHWGPLLTALPVQGLFRAVGELWPAAGADRRPWLDWTPFDEANGVAWDDTNFLELVSIGGLMQLIWSFVILGPAMLVEGVFTDGEKLRHEILAGDYADWAKVFNPVNRLVIDAIPEIDPAAPDAERWKLWLARLATRAFDLRSWTPLIGFVALLLPDGPKSFLEQQASRWSGDLYSTILSADDHFNVEKSFFGGADLRDADRTVPVGEVVRLMVYGEDALDRITRHDRCDAPGSPLAYVQGSSAHPFLTLELTSAGAALVHDDLYEHTGAGPAPAPVLIDNPPASVPASATFLKVSTGTQLRPKLRATVPIPPAVVRAAGSYLLGASPGVWHAVAHSVYAGSPGNDPHTYEARITFESKVLLGTEEIPWDTPAAPGAMPVAPPVKRFVTETQTLVVAGRDTRTWASAAQPGVTLTPRAAGHGWDMAVSAPAGLALPQRARVRIWAKVAKGDPELFDLDHPDVPSLKDRRSYLAEDLWIPVRDFLVEIEDIPAPVAAIAADFVAGDHRDVDLVVKVAGPAQVVSVPPILRAERTGDKPPRGETWRFSLIDRAVADATPVTVTFKFGTPPATVDRQVVLTVKPNFTLDKAAGIAAYEARVGTPLTLTINGGSAPYTIEGQAPAGVTVQVAGNNVTVTVATAPMVALNHDVLVKDSAGKFGVRKVAIRP